MHRFCLTSQDYDPSFVVYVVSKPTRAIWRYLQSEFRALLCCSLLKLSAYALQLSTSYRLLTEIECKTCWVSDVVLMFWYFHFETNLWNLPDLWKLICERNVRTGRSLWDLVELHTCFIQYVWKVFWQSKQTCTILPVFVISKWLMKTCKFAHKFSRQITMFSFFISHFCF